MKHTPKIVHNCRHPRSYSQKYDAYFCEKCDVWVESRCGDPDCEFCHKRPERPSLEESPSNGSGV